MCHYTANIPDSRLLHNPTFSPEANHQQTQNKNVTFLPAKVYNGLKNGKGNG